MIAPSWLSAITGAVDMMPKAGMENFLAGAGPGPDFMDAAKGIGHSMMEHYRRGHADGQKAAGGSNVGDMLGGLPPLEKVALHFQPTTSPDPMMGNGPPAPAAAQPMAQASPAAIPPPVNFQDPAVLAAILAKKAGPVDMAGAGVPMNLAATAFR